MCLLLSLFVSIPDGTTAVQSDDANDSFDFSVTWYRDQLNPAMRYAYDKIIETEPRGGKICVTVPSTIIRDTYPECKNIYDYEEAMESSLDALINALYMERPELNWNNEGYWFYFDSYPSLQCSIGVGIADKEGYWNNSEIKSVIQSIEPHGTSFEVISQIHDYLAILLSYAHEESDIEEASGVTNQSLRNASVALIGTHQVVCGGYAKAFKMICDYYEIPNVAVLGYVREVLHMWNLVFLDGFWYAVDVTWDDRDTGYKSSYLLCGQETVISKKEFSASHAESVHEYGLKLPEPLAQYGYLEDTSNIFFKIDPTETPYVRDYLTGSTIDAADNPSKDGFYFTGWYLDAGCNDLWNPEDGVMSDMVLYAGWSEELQYTLFFRSDGGSDVPEKVKTDAEGEVVIPIQTPSRSGYIFTGWNTKSDGSGSGYLGGDTMTLGSDAVLYACWTSDGSEERKDTESDLLVLCVMFMVLVMPVLCVVCYRRFR